MNPMQGPRNNDVNQGDNEPVYSTESSLMNHPLVDNEFSNSGTPSGRPSSTSQNHNWWRFGESSSMEANHQLPQDGYGGVHSAGYIRDGPSFLRGSNSSSNAMPQHVNMSMDMDSDGYGAQTTSGVVFRHSNYGSSLGSSSVQAAGESSSGPAASSLALWGSSCKRKALEGVPSSSSPDCVSQNENAGRSHYGASSSLTLATPSQSSPNVANHFGRTEPPMFGTNGGGGRAVVAANAFHSVRNTDTSSRPGRRLNPRQPQESVAFSISLGGSSVRPTGSLQQNILLNAPSSVDPLDVRSTSFTSGSSSGENQTNIVHHPALTRNIHQFAWDASRGSSSSGIEMPHWETPRSNPPEQPMFAPATDIRNRVHDQSMWSFARGNPVDSPFVSRAGPSSAIHGQQQQQPNPPWIPPQSAPIHNPTRASELSPWSLFPSIESQTASHGASLPLMPTGPSLSSNEAAMPSSSNSRSHRSRQRRSGLLSERQNELLHLRHLGRSLAADSDGRNHLISEIRQVLSAMRRGESLRIEDYMVLDPLIFQGMTEMHDRHREMRLDVDNMSYEELLALGERIGDVSTGLSEDVILKTMKQHKCTSSSPELHQYMEPCCICQEEYAEGDDLGTLECGHEFHKDCIKQWVMLKNLCPICKTVALTT
ncbi:E3 ubiquitin-protein ligase MBR1 [Raphanus sativus]|uniref:RING-type E3 ubiquitin transferase n=1 Tax=Raphanus sativus TaxID=3726 RepID=A0A6J0JSK1_RAPSA|nr:E3 ubiquitin-protein ligase MBR1 [Raphanus sativus]KAJ4889267.1 E3 ubiquitin-protein ligase MBR1 [Raphanus sativus]